MVYVEISNFLIIARNIKEIRKKYTILVCKLTSLISLRDKNNDPSLLKDVTEMHLKSKVPLK